MLYEGYYAEGGCYMRGTNAEGVVLYEGYYAEGGCYMRGTNAQGGVI